jgi:pimeloyl-ACP methyl ester carboxylesterase
MPQSARYPFRSRYADLFGSKIHYIEEGSGRAFLFLHGNPTWSYLWRNVIPPIAERGRCIAPDLIGFGRSDRPDIGYTFREHYRYVEGFIEELQLKDFVLVGHDWGGVLGFYYALNYRANVSGIAFMESFPFTLEWKDFPPAFRKALKLFRTPELGKFLIMRMNLFVKRVIPAGVDMDIPKSVLHRYLEPFPTARSRYPVYVFPNELPIRGRRNTTYREIEWVEKSLPDISCPVLLLTCTPGGIIGKARAAWLAERIGDLTVKDIGHGIHYMQEDNPAGIADAIVKWATKKNLLQPAEK